MKYAKSKIFCPSFAGKFTKAAVLIGICKLNFAYSFDVAAHSESKYSHKSLLIFGDLTANISVPIRNWKTLRDLRIVKQDLDYSCGAASLATLLNEFYGQSVTEEALLTAIGKGDLRASFEDMQRALPQFGFKAQGFAASYEQLTKLQAPVVVYLKHRNDEHFSVLRGINENTVWLADPSVGNRTYSKAQFLNLWQTRSDKGNAKLVGRFLAVLPNKEGIAGGDDFFTKNPRRQSAQAIQQMSFRSTPQHKVNRPGF